MAQQGSKDQRPKQEGQRDPSQNRQPGSPQGGTTRPGEQPRRPEGDRS